MAKALRSVTNNYQVFFTDGLRVLISSLILVGMSITVVVLIFTDYYDREKNYDLNNYSISMNIFLIYN